MNEHDRTLKCPEDVEDFDGSVFGGLPVGRVQQSYVLFAPNNPIWVWRDRLLDIFGGLRNVPALGPGFRAFGGLRGEWN